MSLPIVAIVTPGSFVIPSSTSSSVELVVQHVVPHLTREVRPIVFGKAAKSMPSCEKRGEVTYIRTPAPTPQAYVRQVGSVT
jgi:spore coat protein SA